jgi:hypothetical protein
MRRSVTLFNIIIMILYREVCDTVNEEKCDSVSEEVCDTVTEEVCESINEEKCETVQVDILLTCFFLRYCPAKLYSIYMRVVPLDRP